MSWSAEKKNPPNPRKRFLQFTSTESESALSSNDAPSPDAHNHAVDSDSDDDELVDGRKQFKFDPGDGESLEQSERPSMGKGLGYLVEQRRREQQEQLRDEMSSHPKKQELVSESESESSDSESDIKPVVTKAEGTSTARLDEAIEESNKGARMLQLMGYKKGEGLGLKKQGRKEPIPMSGQRGMLGLGHKANKELARDLDIRWDETKEVVSEQETALWIKCEQTPPNEATLRSWMEVGRKKMTIDDEDEFCNKDILARMLQAKAVFDDLGDRELREARTRANPFETIGGAFFQNRAAMKTANMDAVFDWILCQTKPDNVQKDTNTGRIKVNKDRDKPLFYFADVCAGPGGFTEYMLWRRGAFNAKGFGFTLKGKDDFKLDKFLAASPEFFEPFYGVDDDGDVMKPHNLLSLEEFVKKSSDGQGVHLFMADGGFSVEGQENIQEILSKRLYLCQFLAALSILRTNGNFVCKLFDLFTPFSVGLVYLMYLAFDRISLHKPHTSRPANSERYIICEKMSERGGTLIKNYLTEINNKLDELSGTDKDVVAVVPLDQLKKDLEFFHYVVNSNESLADRQSLYLEKYKIFARNQGQIDSKQADLREKCMQYWQIPNLNKPFLIKQNRQSPDMTFTDICREVYPTANDVNTPGDLLSRKPADFSLKTLRQYGQGHVVALQMRVALTATREHPAIIIGLGRQSVFIWKKGNTRWERMDAGGNLVRLPRDTIILGEIAEVFKGQGRGLQKSKRLRVFDAMMLAGDNVAYLPFPARYAAIKKFCKAINCVKTQPRFIEVEPAETWRLADFSKERERLEASSIKGEKMIVMHDKDDPEYYLPCRSMRVFSVLNEPWFLCWSKSRQQEYAFHPKNDSKGFEESYLELQCCSTFRFDFLSIEWLYTFSRQNQTARPRQNTCGQVDVLYQTSIWSWLQQASSNYGPDAILAPSTESEDGLTLDALFKAAQETIPTS